MRVPPDPTAAILERRAKPALRLLRAEDVYAPRTFAGSAVPVCEWAWRLHPPVFADREPPDLSRRGELDRAAVTIARVEHGAWIAGCPFCASAQRVSPADPRYLCAGMDGCANGPVRGAYAQILFPAETTRDQIEQALLARPRRENRNWLAHETVADLIAENDEHLGAGWRGKGRG